MGLRGNHCSTKTNQHTSNAYAAQYRGPLGHEHTLHHASQQRDMLELPVTFQTPSIQCKWWLGQNTNMHEHFCFV